MEKFDEKLATWISKKLMVLIIATVALFMDKLSGIEWAYIAFVYIVIQGVIDAKILFKYFIKKP